MDERLTAKTFLHKLMDLTCFWSPGKHPFGADVWDLEKNKDCLPRYFRIQEIESLARAFGISKADFNLPKWLAMFENEKKQQLQLEFEKKPLVQFILDGDFLNRFEPLTHYPEVLNKVHHFHQRFRPYIQESETEMMEIQWIYTSLLVFRQQIQKAIGRAPWILEGKALETIWVHHLKLTLDLEFIDEILSNIIDREKKTYSRKELILHYGYPDIDLRKIDFEDYEDWLG